MNGTFGVLAHDDLMESCAAIDHATSTIIFVDRKLIEVFKTSNEIIF